MLTEMQKVQKVVVALRQLRGELMSEKKGNQVEAINRYLLSASNESYSRLYDLITKKALV